MNASLSVFLCFAIFTIVKGMTPEQRERLLAVHNECSAQTGVSDEVVMKAMAGEFTDDPIFKQHAFCFLKKLGFQNDAGEMQPEVVKEKLKMCITDEPKYNEIISKCIVQKGTPEDTAFEFTKCMCTIEHAS